MKKAQRQDKDKRSQLYYAAGQVQNSRTYTDGDFIFTEHNLDTKEDEREEEKRSSLALRDDRVPDETAGPSKSKDGKKEDVKAKSIHDIQPRPLLKNSSSKSLIFAPFNSSFSDYDEDHPEKF